MSDIWAVEYSIKQGAFHVDTLARILELNQNNVSKGIDSGYCILALRNSQKECHEATKELLRNVNFAGR